MAAARPIISTNVGAMQNRLSLFPSLLVGHSADEIAIGLRELWHRTQDRSRHLAYCRSLRARYNSHHRHKLISQQYNTLILNSLS